jgi:hypothetical protein
MAPLILNLSTKLRTVVNFTSQPLKSPERTTVSTGHTQKNGAVSKVNKNVFLTLHGHNIHRQRQQLSKFLSW